MTDLPNGFANFKGVMLCSRPVDKADRKIDRDFCSTVTHKAMIGLNPTNLKERKERKKVLKALVNHKKWLSSLKQEVESKKQRAMQQVFEEEIFKVKIKEHAEKKRIELKSLSNPLNHAQERSNSLPVTHNQEIVKVENYDDTNIFAKPRNAAPPIPSIPINKITPQLNPVYETDLSNQGKPKDMKKKSKPAWALSANDQKELEDQEADELLEFMDKFDAEKYAQDTQVKEMLQTLKNRVSELKSEDNWKENWEGRLKEKKKRREEEYLREKAIKEIDDDMVPQNGDVKSQGGSIHSRLDQISNPSRAESIRSIKEKMENESQGIKEWNGSISGKSNPANLEERLAKHIADELLRNNPALARIHSNNSVRRVIEQELRKEMEQKKQSQ